MFNEPMDLTSDEEKISLATPPAPATPSSSHTAHLRTPSGQWQVELGDFRALLVRSDPSPAVLSGSLEGATELAGHALTSGEADADVRFAKLPSWAASTPFGSAVPPNPVDTIGLAKSVPSPPNQRDVWPSPSYS